ncbi:MAG: tetratricopeptide repeat protein [Gammaproteobacteria bacterium]|nr:tetratricopeptide repeat protein [Gammaproteobacteria bacterium]NNC98541.1 tetratricopeptide repeat protein [Gammaproteobacteria bacterium]
MSFFKELKRRNVVRTAVTYIVVAWLLIQVGNVLFTTLELDTSANKLLFAILLLGFFPALIFSWVYEITPEGIQHEKDLERDESYTNLTAKKLDIVTIILLVFAIALFGVDRFINNDANYNIDTFQLDDQQALVQSTPQATSIKSGPKIADLPSIAVLAFANMSIDQANSYFSDGISEEILNTLVKVDGLRVVARTSSFAWKGKQADLREIGEKLNADHILEGSVRRAGDKVRITAQLINTSDGFHLWSETYDRELDDIFSVQEDIAKAIVDALRINLMADSEVGKVGTANIDAYDLYLQGRAKLREAGFPEDFTAAIDLFDSALSLDNKFAEAHAGRCESFTRHYSQALDNNLIDLAIAACSQAEELDPDAPQVLISKGDLYIAQGKFDEALRSFNKAVNLRPNFARAYRGRAEAYSELGDIDAAVDNMETAIALQPDDVDSHVYLGVIMFNNSRFERAAEEFLQSIKLQPDNDRHYSNLGGVYFYLGEFGKAAEVFRQSIALAPNSYAYSNAGTNYYYQGEYEAALAMFQHAVDLNVADNLFHGNLADTCRWVPSCAKHADEHYRTAIKQAQKQLMINPKDSVILAQLGAYLARVGDFDQAQDKIDLARQLNPNSPEVLYSAALVAKENNQPQAAAKFIQAALRNGYPDKAMQADPDLKNLIK